MQKYRDFFYQIKKVYMPTDIDFFKAIFTEISTKILCILFQ